MPQKITCLYCEALIDETDECPECGMDPHEKPMGFHSKTSFSISLETLSAANHEILVYDSKADSDKVIIKTKSNRKFKNRKSLKK